MFYNIFTINNLSKPCLEVAATSVRERMDHLYNNPDMSDLTISATDQAWSWGNTSQEFIVSTRASNEDITITNKE